MPKAKPFQYGTLLRVRKRQEDLRAQALAQARRDLHAQERSRAEIVQRQRQMLEEAGRASANPFTVDEIRRFYQYERHLANMATHADARIGELGEAAEQRRLELEEAMKRRRVLELLQERRQQAFAAEIRKREQAAADESATSRAAIAAHSAEGNAFGQSPQAKRGSS